MKKHCGEAIREFELHNKQTTELLYTLGQSLSRSLFHSRAYNYGLMHTHTLTSYTVKIRTFAELKNEFRIRNC